MDETSSSDHNNQHNNIPIEIVSDEEMALIEAAFVFASSSARSSVSAISSTPSSPHHLHTNALSIKSITLLSKRRLSDGSGSGPHHDIEDSPKLVTAHKKKTTVPDSFLHRFRRKRCLSVTDLTSTVSSLFIFYVVFPFFIGL